MKEVKCQIREDKSEELRVKTSKSLSDIFFKYTHLPIGGKEIVCPYWVNNLKLGIFGPYGGKGTPEQIVEIVDIEAKNAGLDLRKMTETEVLNFMKGKRIGIDCSGFVFRMLDSFDKEKGGNGIADDIPGSVGRYLQARANVKMLTDSQIAVDVELNNICVGDMLRLNGGKHVGIVLRIFREGERLKEIEYAHCSSRTKIPGVHSAKVVIVKEGNLENQQWEEKTVDMRNYGQIYYLPELGDGFKRLKIWN